MNTLMLNGCTGEVISTSLKVVTLCYYVTKVTKLHNITPFLSPQQYP